MDEKKADREIFVATVTQYSSSLGARLRIDGQPEASDKYYKRLYGVTVSAGSRVLVAKVSGTYVILGRIT